MIQLAMPVEPGNSGGPLLDRFGRVHGILTLKSAVTENLGFAMPVNALKPLIAKPNPISMAKWLTIGAIDPDDWTIVFGGRWRQRAGRILVDGAGNGFGDTPPIGRLDPAAAVAGTSAGITGITTPDGPGCCAGAGGSYNYRAVRLAYR